MPKLPEFKDWKAPWEKSGTEFSPDVARKFIYDLHKDVEKGAEENSTLKTQNTELQTKVSEAEKASMTDAEKAAAERADLEKKLADAGQKSLEVTRLELALEHGLTKSQARRLVGNTAEELTADAEDLVKDLGLTKETESTEGKETVNGRRTPGRLKNPLLNDDESNTGISADQLLEKLPRL